MRAPATRSAEKKKEAILIAATDLFIERGYDGVSVDAIVRRAGGSKTNIYNYFGGKEELFRAIVEDLSQQILSPLARAEIDSLPPREALFAVGKQVLSVVLSDRAIALLRAIVAQTPRFPELGKLFFETGPSACGDRLARYLEKQQQVGVLEFRDSHRAAERFLGSLLGLNQLQRLLGIAPAPGEEEIEAIVAHAVDTFLEGHQVSS